MLAILGSVDKLLVIGSANSSNAQRLVDIADRRDTPARLIDGPHDIDPAWLAGVTRLGLTAGASTPSTLTDEVVRFLRTHRDVRVVERTVTTETVHFALPKQVTTP